MLVDGINLAEGSGDRVIGLARDKIITQPGVVAPVAGTTRWTTPNKIRLLSIVARVNSAPIGRDLTLNIKKNGVPVTSTPITIAANNNSVTVNAAQMASSTAEANDYFTMDVLNVGSTYAGADLTVQLNYTETE